MSNRTKFISTLRHAGLIHAHAGHEALIHNALDEYDRGDLGVGSSATPVASNGIFVEPSELQVDVDTHAEEIADAENNHGQDVKKEPKPRGAKAKKE